MSSACYLVRYASVNFHTLNLWLWQFLLLAISAVFLPLQYSGTSCTLLQQMYCTQPACSEVCWQLLLAQVVLTVRFCHSLLFYLMIQKVKSQMLLSCTASFPSCGAIIEPNEACSPTYGSAISNVSIDYVSPDAKLMPRPINAERNRMYSYKSKWVIKFLHAAVFWGWGVPYGKHIIFTWILPLFLWCPSSCKRELSWQDVLAYSPFSLWHSKRMKKENKSF